MGHVLIHQIKPQMNQHKMFLQVLVLVCLQLSYFVILSFTSKITCQNIQGLSSNNFYTLPRLNWLQKGKYTPINT